MIEIPIPETIKVGGYDYSVLMDNETTKGLQEDALWGRCRSQTRRIMIGNDLYPQQMSSTFTHELLHAISDVYLAQREVSEEQTSALANGLLQVFEQLGIRFVKKDV